MFSIQTMLRPWFLPMLLVTIASLIISGLAGSVVAESRDPMSPGSNTTVGSTMCGTKFNDVNGTGVQDAGEPGLAGWTIQLLDAAGFLVATTISGPTNAAGLTGTFCFTGVTDGVYTVREVSQTGWLQTFPVAPGTHNVTIGAGTPARTLLFGNMESSAPGGTAGSSICGSKYDDVNGTGVQDAGEPFLSGWTFQLLDAAGNVVNTAITSTETATSLPGRFCFDSVKDGSYTVREVLQAGWVQTQPTAPGTYSVSVGAGTAPSALHFGNMRASTTGRICGFKFEDKNDNGLQDDGELGLGGWTIHLTDATGQAVASAVTRENGIFCFENLRLGDYTVSEVMQSGWVQTLPGGTGTYSVQLSAAQSETKPLLFGNIQTPRGSLICGTKFEDKNGNRKQDAGENGLGGWTIQVKDAAGNVVATEVTRDNGTYCFRIMSPGVYTFTEVMQDGYQQTFPAAPGTHTLSVVGGQDMDRIDFGNQKTPDPCCLNFDFLAGRADNFATADGAEPAQPSAALAGADFADLILGSFETTGFDGTVLDRFMLHTFILPTGQCVESASLEFKAKPLGFSTDDTVAVKFAGVPGSPSWGSYLGPFQPGTGLVATHWTSSNYAAGQVFTLNLNSLPGNFIATLNTHRFLDFRVRDDTSVDYARLTVTFCECDSAGPAHVDSVVIKPGPHDIGFVDGPISPSKPVDDSVSQPGPTPGGLGVNIRLVVDSSEASVNGKILRLSAPAVIRNGSTLLPFRPFGELLGAEVQWNVDERRATYLLGSSKVEVWIGRLMARVNGADYFLTIAPVLIDGTAYAPVRSIVESLGLSVEYDPADRSIRIFDR